MCILLRIVQGLLEEKYDILKTKYDDNFENDLESFLDFDKTLQFM